MQIHHKITHHLHKHKERILTHVKNHHKKYLFGGGMVFGMTILVVIIFAGVILGVNMMIGRSQSKEQNTEIYKQIAVFSILDDFMHKRYAEISAMKDSRTAEIDKAFSILDAAYHEARNISERYQAAKKEVEFITNTGHNLLKELGYTTPENDRKLDEIIYEFYQIK